MLLQAVWQYMHGPSFPLAGTVHAVEYHSGEIIVLFILVPVAASFAIGYLCGLRHQNECIVTAFPLLFPCGFINLSVNDFDEKNTVSYVFICAFFFLILALNMLKYHF